MSPPAISVCVPTYNGAAFLAETLASVATQTFADYEVIVLDDLSTDDTLEIANTFAAADDRVRVLRNADRAGSSARNANRCLPYARGEWIKFVFQDDLMAPTCLARMLDAGRRGRLVIAWHDYRFAADVDDETRTYYTTLPTLAAELPTAYADADAFSDAVLRQWGVNFIGPTSSSLIHRSCFADHGEFSAEITSFPDLEYWIRVGNQEGLSIVQQALVTFRVHNASISRSLRDDARRQKVALEPLALLLLLARAVEYENIRSRVPLQHPPMDLEALIKEWAVETRWWAIDARYRKRDERPLDQWNAFCRRHPELRDILRQFDATRSQWSRVKQFLKSRL